MVPFPQPGVTYQDFLHEHGMSRDHFELLNTDLPVSAKSALSKTPLDACMCSNFKRVSDRPKKVKVSKIGIYCIEQLPQDTITYQEFLDKACLPRDVFEDMNKGLLGGTSQQHVEGFATKCKLRQ
jgi:hypothetical protein